MNGIMWWFNFCPSIVCSWWVQHARLDADNLWIGMSENELFAISCLDRRNYIGNSDNNPKDRTSNKKL